jgi:hypothetical protein
MSFFPGTILPHKYILLVLFYSCKQSHL